MTTFMGGALSFKGEPKKKKVKAKKKQQNHGPESDERKRDEVLGGAQSQQAAEAGNHGVDALTSLVAVSAASVIINEDDLTEAERKALKRKMERERKELEKIAQKSHRERVEEFNEKLGKLTEHNDIPRVSAAGNG